MFPEIPLLLVVTVSNSGCKVINGNDHQHDFNVNHPKYTAGNKAVNSISSLKHHQIGVIMFHFRLDIFANKLNHFTVNSW